MTPQAERIKSMLISALARAIAEYEGFFKPGTRARKNLNPGNVRTWKDASGKSYPQTGGFVDFNLWAKSNFPNMPREDLFVQALAEGWRVLEVLLDRYISGKHHKGRSPSLLELVSVYAPAADGNRPEAYASYLAKRLGIPADVPLQEIIDRLSESV